MTAAAEGAGPPDADRLRASGERVEALLEAAAAQGPVARERAEQLVRELLDLYGAGLARLLDVLRTAGRLDGAALDALATDDLVASLLLVHGLHPHGVERRVRDALDAVRPYLGSHGGDVEFVGVEPDGAVRLRMLGSCRGCPSSSVTLSLAVETAVTAAAPEVTGVVVEEPKAPVGVIPVDALRSRLQEQGPAATPRPVPAGWTAVADVAGLGPGEVGGFRVGGVDVLACRVGRGLYAFVDRCPRCLASMAGAVLTRRLGSRAGTAGATVLTCPICRAHYDPVRAGAGLDGDGASNADGNGGNRNGGEGTGALHLDPLPLLVREGVVSIAVPDVGAVR